MSISNKDKVNFFIDQNRIEQSFADIDNNIRLNSIEIEKWKSVNINSLIKQYSNETITGSISMMLLIVIMIIICRCANKSNLAEAIVASSTLSVNRSNDRQDPVVINVINNSQLYPKLEASNQSLTQPSLLEEIRSALKQIEKPRVKKLNLMCKTAHHIDSALRKWRKEVKFKGIKKQSFRRNLRIGTPFPSLDSLASNRSTLSRKSKNNLSIPQLPSPSKKDKQIETVGPIISKSSPPIHRPLPNIRTRLKRRLESQSECKDHEGHVGMK